MQPGSLSGDVRSLLPGPSAGVLVLAVPARLGCVGVPGVSGIADRMADGYQPDFDIDAAAGRQGELLVADVIRALRDGSAEVKTDEMALVTGNVYIECECLRRGKWRPSGVMATGAEIW